MLTWVVFLAVPTATSIASWWWPEPPAAGAALGRQVYIAEGCIHCHSQYVRPGADDEDRLGHARDPEFSLGQSPVLIGNRRQGPDLMNIGLRLPREWHREHLQNPRRVAPASRMPAYAHLFAPGDPRGEALLDYLDSLGRENATATGAAPVPSGARSSDPIPPTEGNP
jgi:cytochrome c oxidase cbb3-type subunit 2